MSDNRRSSRRSSRGSRASKFSNLTNVDDIEIPVIFLSILHMINLQFMKKPLPALAIVIQSKNITTYDMLSLPLKEGTSVRVLEVYDDGTCFGEETEGSDKKRGKFPLSHIKFDE